jgi:hypothetical protein
MIDIRNGNPEDKGVWFGCSEHEVHQAIVNCPLCDGAISLIDHTIYDDGKVFPSVKCPHEFCNWEKYICLAGWEK